MNNHRVFCATVVRNRLLLLLACLSKWFAGVYVGDEHPEDQAMFVSEKCCFTDLVNGLSSPCWCGLTMKPWQLESATQVSNDDVHAHVGIYFYFWLSILERTCASNSFCLPSLSSAKDLVEFANTCWTLPSQPKVGGVLIAVMCIYLLSRVHRMIHAFTSAGMLPSQYINFSTFSGIGNVGHRYISRGSL